MVQFIDRDAGTTFNRGLGPKHTIQLRLSGWAACSAINNQLLVSPETPVVPLYQSSAFFGLEEIVILNPGFDGGPSDNKLPSEMWFVD